MGLYDSDDNSDETALVVGGEFFILNGDFREQYAACDGDIQKIKQVYIDNMEDKQSTWSSDRTDEEKFVALIDRFANLKA